MAKKSILSEAQETIVEAAKTGVAIAKLAATVGLAAAGPAAAGVVLNSVSKGLQRAEQKVANVTPGQTSEASGIPTPAVKKTPRRKAAAGRKKRVAVNKRSSSKKKKTTKKAAKKSTTARRTTTRNAKTKRGAGRRKR